MFRRSLPFSFSSSSSINSSLIARRFQIRSSSSSSHISSLFKSTPTLLQQQSAPSVQQQQQLKPSELIRQVDVNEGIPRYPDFTTVTGCIRALDYLGTAAFAVSGSLLAAMFGLNAFGCTCVGATTALGGGAIRDMVFGTTVAFIDEYEYLILALAAGALTFIACLYYAPTPKHLESYERAMFWLDSVGLGAFCVIGTMYGAKRSLPLILILLSTLLCCTGGGVCRDLLVGRPVRILNNYAEAYAECVLTGCLVYYSIKKMGYPVAYRAIGGWSTVVCARILASTYNFSLPQAIALRSAVKKPEYQR